MRARWRVVSFDPAVPMELHLVLDSDDPRTIALVEQAADAWGVELEREPDEDGVVHGVVIVQPPR